MWTGFISDFRNVNSLINLLVFILHRSSKNTIYKSIKNAAMVMIKSCLFFYFSAPPKFLQPFLSDKNMPSELEYMIVSFDEPHVYLRQWNDESVFQEIQFSTQADSKLLECRNVTMQSVVKPFKVWGQIAVSSSTAGRLFNCTIMVDPIFISFGQYALHSLNTAIQAWQQVCKHNNEKKCSYCD